MSAHTASPPGAGADESRDVSGDFATGGQVDDEAEPAVAISTPRNPVAEAA
jgi:hypothetical protein